MLAIVFSFIIYRRTNPLIPTSLRIFLSLTRTAALLLLLFIIYETTAQYRRRRDNPPILAIAVDNSASMTITDSQGSRRQIIKNILADDFITALMHKFDVLFYSFANDITPFSPHKGDSLDFLGDVTDIRKSLEMIKSQHVTQNLTNILLISDGNYNAGGNPLRFAEELGIPINTIGIGSSDPVKDVLIAEINANPFAYVDLSTPLSVTLRNTGYDKLTIPVEILHDDELVAREILQLPASPSEKAVSLPFTPRETGRLKLDIRVPHQTDELLVENNTRSLYMDVYKSKLSIFLIAGSVSPDIAFLKRALQNDRYLIRTLVHKKNGAFYEPQPTRAELADIDIFVFLDYPTVGSSEVLQQNLLMTLESKMQPILLIPGSNTVVADLLTFSDYIPLQSGIKPDDEITVYVELSPLGRTHPIMHISDDTHVSNTIWRELPPVFAPLVTQHVPPGTEVLAYARPEGQTNQTVFPLIAIRTNGLHKSAAIFASQLWRWDFMMRGINRFDDVYSRLVQNCVRWLETNRSESLLRVTTDKTHYKYGDPILMTIDVYDENLHPVEDAQVSISLQGHAGGQAIRAQSRGQGEYLARLQAPQPGDYKAQVSAEANGRRLGEESILFSVGEYSAELADIQAQPAVLQSLARATGGRYVTKDSTALLVSAMQGNKTTSEMIREVELWHNRYILLIIIVLLTTEWFIRKRRGMV